MTLGLSSDHLQSDSPYRSDEDARQMRLEHLETENDILVHQNTELVRRNHDLENENRRLKIIGRELLADQPKPAPVRPMTVDMRREIAEMAERTQELQMHAIALRKQTRWMLFWIGATGLMYMFVRMLLFV